MDKKKAANFIISLGLVICIAAIIFIASFKANSFSKEFYAAEFKKYEVYEKFYGQDIEGVNQEVLGYIRGETNSLNADFFEKNEIEHLDDVRELIQSINLVYYLALLVSSVLIIALYIMGKKRLIENMIRVVFCSGIFAIILALIIAALAALSFDFVFTPFHYIFFPQGGWLFNASDRIVNLYPSGLFYDASKRIFIGVIAYSSVLALAGILAKYLNKLKRIRMMTGQ